MHARAHTHRSLQETEEQLLALRARCDTEKVEAQARFDYDKAILAAKVEAEEATRIRAEEDAAELRASCSLLQQQLHVSVDTYRR